MGLQVCHEVCHERPEPVTMKMHWTTLFAIWALTLAATFTVIRNFWGQEAVDDWYSVVVWALTLGFLGARFLAVRFRRDAGSQS